MIKFSRFKHSILALFILLALSALPAHAQLKPPNVYVSSGLIVRYTGGTLYTGTTATTIATGTITLTASKSSCVFPALTSCMVIYWPGSGTALLATATPATAFASGNIVLGTATTSGSAVLVLTVFNNQPGTGPGWNQANSNYLSDGYIFVSPVNCGKLATTTTTTDNGMVPAATGNVVHQFTTNTTGGTTQITCEVDFPSRTTVGKGWLITDVSLLYGVQTTAISSIAAATVNTVAYPAADGTTASGTVASAGGTLVVTPAVLATATTTTGQCYQENLAFPTLVSSVNLKKLTVDQVFTNSAAATVYQICGLMVHYFNSPL